MRHFLMAIDQGTTNSRAIIFNPAGEVVAQHEVSLSLFFPRDGWVEQDPVEMFNYTVVCCREALKKSQLDASQIAAIGISNQRETTIIWDKRTGIPIYPAIVWQDRRTHDLCAQLAKAKTKMGTYLPKNTGLRLDPYFSATKIMWLFEHVPEARERAARNELLFGTVDTFLLWKLTQGKIHATDATNASRTMLYNIHTQDWDAEILQALDIPKNILPAVLDNAANFGVLDKSILGADIPIAGMAGDQQAATIGQACFQRGMVKATFGTGCFMLLNTGSEVIESQQQLISTVAYRLEGKVTYGLEGSIFCAGATVKWLRDELQIIKTADETEALAQLVPNNGGTYLIPAFTGLGAPYWQPNIRAAIFGLTRNTNRSHIVRAALESVAYQSKDLLDAMIKDSQIALAVLRVDGGMTVNNWLLQFITDMLNLEVQRPRCIETSALGVAYLAGLQIGIYHSIQEIEKLWEVNAKFLPQMPAKQRNELYDLWKAAVMKLTG